MKKFPILHSKLKDKACQLLNNRPSDLKIAHIAKATGISETWLHMFSRNQIPKPDVGRVEALYNFLNKTPLEV